MKKIIPVLLCFCLYVPFVFSLLYPGPDGSSCQVDLLDQEVCCMTHHNCDNQLDCTGCGGTWSGGGGGGGPSCGAESQLCCSGDVCNSGLYCSSGYCCYTGWSWRGTGCQEQFHCNDICPFTPADGEFWFDTDCIVYLAPTYEACCITGNYGDSTFKEYIDITVY